MSAPDDADRTPAPPPGAGPGPSADPFPGPGPTGPPPEPTGPPPPSPQPQPPPVEAAVPVRRTVAVAVAAVLALSALGVPFGLLWAVLAPGTPVLKTDGGAVYADTQPEQPIAADGWFSLLGLGFGVLAALGLWFLLRRHRGPVGLLVGGLGGLGAAVVGWQVGRRIGLTAYQDLLASAPVGQGFDKPADLRAGGVDLFLGWLPWPHGNLLLPAFAAVVTYTLLAGWSRWPSLRPETEPAEVSWVPAGSSAPAAAPAPPAPDAAEPPRG